MISQAYSTRQLITIIVVALVSLNAMQGCVSINSLPQSADEVNFQPDVEGRTGWSQYEEVVRFNGVGLRTAYLAAKSGLADANFTIKRANYDKRVVIGEHGLTAYDWNVVGAVYLREDRGGVDVKVLVEGSKDVGFWGDMTADSWPQKILKGMREYILTESSIGDPDRGLFE